MEFVSFSCDTLGIFKAMDIISANVAEIVVGCL